MIPIHHPIIRSFDHGSRGLACHRAASPGAGAAPSAAPAPSRSFQKASHHKRFKIGEKHAMQHDTEHKNDITRKCTYIHIHIHIHVYVSLCIYTIHMHVHACIYIWIDS